jgi:hypothetical protein
MTRYILMALSLAVAGAVFFSVPRSAATVTGHIIYSISYAFTPAVIGFAFAWLKKLIQNARGKKVDFAADWHWMWAIFLILLLAVLAIRLT